MSGFVQVQWGRRDKTHCQKQLFSFQNEHSKEEPQKHSGSKNEAFSTQRLCGWRHRKNSDKSSMHCVFSRKKF